jgi:hypothetical protein
VTAHGAREVFALGDGVGERLEDGGERGSGPPVAEQAEAAEERDAGAEEIGELGVRRGELAGGDAAGDSPRLGGGLDLDWGVRRRASSSARTACSDAPASTPVTRWPVGSRAVYEKLGTGQSLTPRSRS